MPKHQRITVTLKNGKFDYDQNGKPHMPNHHVHDQDAISWMSPDGDIDITFPNGCDPTNGKTPSAKKGKWTTPVTLYGKKGDICKYDVTINGKTDDPMIIFDGDDDLLGLETADLKTIADSAQGTLGKLVAELTAVANLKADPQRLFFPQGINLISVDVEVGAVKVIIKVAGPGVTVLEKAAEE